MATSKTSERARLGRQRILDSMPKGKWIAAAQVARKLREPVRSVAARLGIMRAVGEVESRDSSKDQFEFRALVEETRARMPMNPAAVEAMNEANQRAASPHDTDEPTTRLPGYLKHEGSRRRTALTSSGGQGAVPLAFGIQSSMG